MIGGGSSPNSRVDIYNVTSDTWTTANLSQPRARLTATSVGNAAFFADGSLEGSSSASDRVDIYNLTSNTWTTANLSLP